jgi:colanic acid/amylovoran biosynthesis glycosyltransferase
VPSRATPPRAAKEAQDPTARAFAGAACAYLTSRYPGLTHSFIVGEVRGLRELGIRVDTVSVRRVSDDEVLSPLDAEEHRRTYAILPTSMTHVIRCHTRALLRHPRAYVGTLGWALRQSPPGFRAHLWGLFYFGEAMLLWSWLRDRDLHHVHVHHANVAADVALLACHFANHDSPSPRWTWSLSLHGPTELWDVQSHNLPMKMHDASAVVCISDFTRSQVSAFMDPSDLERLHTVRCGIDVAHFCAAHTPRPENGNVVRILCVAAMSRRKGHAVLLEAMSQLVAQDMPVRLTLAGDGPERPRLEADVRRLGLVGAVDFVGAVGHGDVVNLYAACDIFCLPSFSEGLPTVLMEAMAMERPVVATNVMAVSELVEHEHSGLLVPPARADLLADALARLVRDREERSRMGKAGRARVVQDFDQASAVKALAHVLVTVILA